MRSVLVACLVLLVALPASAASLMHSGYLLDGANAPVNSSVPMTFELFAAATGGTALWSSGTCTITPKNGYYATELGGAPGCGAALPAAIFASGAAYLEVTVNGVLLAQRQPLAAVPSAQTSVDAQALKSALAAGGTVNAPTNPVDWSQLKGVPASVLGGGGTVTSVALALPAELAVSGSPVTTSGSLGASWASQSPKTFLAAPAAAAGTPSFRAIAGSDLPALDASAIGTGVVAPARLGTGPATSSTFLRGDGSWQVPAANVSGVVTLTDAASIAVDAALGNVFQVTLGGNRTIANPTNLVAGQRYTFKLVQDATGGRIATWGSAYDVGTTPIASAFSLFTFLSDGTSLFSLGTAHSGVLCSGAGVTQAARKCTFAASGFNQALTVSSGISLTVKAWGAAGGPPGPTRAAGYTTGRGGHGGFVKATFAVPVTTSYAVVVGKGGAAYATSSFGGGGASSTAAASSAYAGGAGGGLTGIFAGSVTQSAALLVAGGGGGAGGNYTQNGGDACTGNTLNGADGSAYPSDSGGFGGTTGGPGPGGGEGRCGSGGMPGNALLGGGAQNTCNNAAAGGGGGGGGYWGGGGSGSYYAGGGAGSSFIAASGTSTSQLAGPNSADGDYPGAPVAAGSSTVTGGNGALVVTW